jgi:hypothetical protein
MRALPVPRCQIAFHELVHRVLAQPELEGIRDEHLARLISYCREGTGDYRRKQWDHRGKQWRDYELRSGIHHILRSCVERWPELPGAH